MTELNEMLDRMSSGKSSKTKQQYKTDIKQLMTLFKITQIDEFVKVFEDPEKLLLQVNSRYPNKLTARNKLNTLIILLKQLKDKFKNEEYEGIYKQLSNIVKQVNNENEENGKSGKLSERQSDNLVKNIEYLEILKKMRKRIDMTDKSRKNVNDFQDYIMLLIYFYHAQRSELGNLQIITADEFVKNEDDLKENYLVIKIGKNGSFKQRYTMMLHDFKTQKKYKREVVPIHKRVEGDLSKYLKLNNNQYVFLNSSRSNYLTRNALGKRFSSIFYRFTKKRFSIQLNRIRGISSNKDDVEFKKSLKEFTERARSRGHSVKTTINFYLKDLDS